jgi:hypothetical protein
VELGVEHALRGQSGHYIFWELEMDVLAASAAVGEVALAVVEDFLEGHAPGVVYEQS